MAEERRLRAALSAADRAVMEAHNALVKARSESGGASAQVSQLINLLDAVQRKRGSAQRTGLEAEVIDLERNVSTLQQMVLTLAAR
jgi:ethanolamine utilization microcompartment shell protein EutL